MNFGQTFVSWIRLLYTDITSCCSNNGHTSRYFQPTRGIRQGCPISALLFILVAEILAINLRNNDNIEGIEIDGTTFLISQLADDTSLFLKNQNSFEASIELLENFSTCSGLKLNKNKTEIFYLGNTNHRPNFDVHGISKVSTRFKSLGIHFSNNLKDMYELNLEEKYQKFKSIINLWSQRELSLKGKITVLKSLALSQLLYATSNLHVLDEFIDRIDKDIQNFVWNNKPPKIKTSTMSGNMSAGGMNMPSFRIMVQTQKVMWVKKE